MQTAPDALSVSLDIGEAMLRSGADVHRVEDTIDRINRAYGAKQVEVFSINSLILATVGHGAGSRTESRRVTSFSTDLGRLEAFNDLSRRICRCTPPPEQALSSVRALNVPLPHREQWLTGLGYLLGAGGFCLFFGGGWADALAAAAIGALLWCSDRLLRPHLPNHLVYTLLTAMLMGLLASGAGQLIPMLQPDKIMIGDIMLQIPGLILINGLRDMLLGDTMTGCLRTVDAILTAVAIAVGFAVPLLIWPATYGSGTAGPAIQIIFAGFGTLGFSLFFHIRRRRLLPAVLGSVLTIAIYLLCEAKTGNRLVSYMVSAIFAGAYAELSARALHAPATVFLIPGLIPLLPGAGLYYTMTSMVAGNSADFVHYGIETVHAAVGIAVGVLFSSILMLLLRKTIRRIAV